MTPEEMREIMREFKERHPDKEGLNIREMKKILDKELVIVRVSGTKKFQLMTPAEVAPGGKLALINESRREEWKAWRRAKELEREAFLNSLPSKDRELLKSVLKI